MPPSEGDITHTLPQHPSQELLKEAESLISTSSRRWNASARALESREQESLNWNTAFTAVQGK